MQTSPVLARIRYVLADMDGVFYRGDVPLPGAADFARWTNEHGIACLYITNNSTRTPQQYAEKLAAMGIRARPEDILTSSLATRAYLETHAPRGTGVYLIGERGLEEALFGDGYFVPDEESPSYVVAGLDTHVTYDKLRRAALAIRKGAQFVGTNPDRTFPSPGGITPGTGSLLAFLEAATDVHPLIIGKPERWMMGEGLRRLGADRAHTAVLGDRLETDILGGKRMGLLTLMVLTGIHGLKDILETSIEPDLVFADLGELQQAWQAALGIVPPEQ